jgi:hypothetical protein
MSYDLGDLVRYSIIAGTFTSDVTRSFGPGPKGKKGTLVDVGFDGVTTTFAGATNGPQIEVGITGTLAAYVALWTPALLVANQAGQSLRSTYRKTDAGWATYMVNDVLPADTAFVVTVKAAAGGGAAGVGDAFVLARWDL